MSNDSVIPFEEASKAEKENIEKTKTLLGKQIRNYVDFYELLYNLFEHSGNQSRVKNVIYDYRDSVVLMLGSRIVISSKAYLDLVLKGYYYDSEVIFRSLVESIGIMRLLVGCRDKQKANMLADKWLKGKLDHQTVRKELNLSPSIGYSRLYRGLCDYVHSNFDAVKTLTTPDFADGSIETPPKPSFKRERALSLLYPHMEVVISLLLENFSDMIEPSFKIQTKNSLKRLIGEREELKKQNQS